MTRDPVCGMTVDPGRAPAKAEHAGTSYYFCCARCKQTFDKDPALALSLAPSSQSSIGLG